MPPGTVQYRSPSNSGLSLSLRYKLWELVRHILPTGCYAFGGPTAHLAVFHDLFVKKLRWLTDKVLFAGRTGYVRCNKRVTCPLSLSDLPGVC